MILDELLNSPGPIYLSWEMDMNFIALVAFCCCLSSPNSSICMCDLLVSEYTCKTFLSHLTTPGTGFMSDLRGTYESYLITPGTGFMNDLVRDI